MNETVFQGCRYNVAALLVAGGIAPVAQGQALQVVTPEQQESYVQQFHHEGDTPPVVDGVGGYTEQEIAEIHEAIRQAQESGTPNEELIPGEMWSDKVELPSTIDKAAADEAEIAIAQQQAQPQARGLAAAAACQTFWPSPHQVCGAILERYIQQGAQFGWMLLPTEGQALNPDGQGYRQRFMAGFIYWNPSTGAHAVNNYSAQVWERNGWETGWMGYPTGGEVPVSGSDLIDGELNGWVQTFQGGRVYRSPFLEGFQAASINGLILDKWLELGGPESALGFPIADEAVTTDGVGRFSIFENGNLYWHPETGVHQVDTLIYEVWANSGSTSGQYGYPTSDPYISDDGSLAQDFQTGTINLNEELANYGYTRIGNKDVSNLIIAYLQRNGLSADTYSYIGSLDLGSPDSLRTLQARAGFTISNGGVTLPTGYEYKPSKGSLNDYCTKSPDTILYGTVVADFRGACARHDVCYDNVNNSTEASADYALCNRFLQKDMMTVCANVFGAKSLGQRSCNVTARAYFAAVVTTHPSHWEGHLGGGIYPL
ncbi:hypothetical protein CDES_03675 [Corynebacterium deserti GIMN1.010]|uniref:LGFP repeat-containing protein n=1 Tax=Corynebacterium deserti GIMN1.010 TaxID=931089 RepID=A0A0M4CVV7_9CORY|nr:phospholipase A2 [Corynebacterium deserti]ALC05187.1 hypothetical protein CDES_03675 [Corynebacterium deserti GIMN1.010]